MEEVGDAFFSIGPEFAILNLVLLLRVYCETKSRVNNEKESPHHLDTTFIIKSKQLSHPIQDHPCLVIVSCASSFGFVISPAQNEENEKISTPKASGFDHYLFEAH